MFFGTAVLFILFFWNNCIFIWFDSLNCIKQMPYTHEKISNIIEEKNSPGQDKTLTVRQNQWKHFSFLYVSKLMHRTVRPVPIFRIFRNFRYKYAYRYIARIWISFYKAQYIIFVGWGARTQRELPSVGYKSPPLRCTAPSTGVCCTHPRQPK